MKKLLLYIVIFLLSFAGHAQAQTVPIPDAAFLSFLKANFPQTIDANDQLIINKAALITSNLSCQNCNITNLEGVQYFSKVPKINFANNQIVSIPSLLPMTALETVHLYTNQLATAPDFSGLKNLKTVLLYENQLTAMPLFGNNPIIEEIIISKNKIKDTTSLAVVPSLLKLDVGENQLTQLPDLSLNINLEELICWSNQLTVLPSLVNLTKLFRLNASKNKLTITPDFTKNTQLSILALNGNLLTTGPAIAGFSNLTDVQLYNNYFTFEDLLPYTSMANFSTAFDCTPMLRLPIADTIEAYFAADIYAGTYIDRTIPDVNYTFIENGNTLPNAGKDSTLITETIQPYRYVYAKLTHPSIPALTLTTDSIVVHFNACPSSAAVTYTVEKPDCSSSGSVQIQVQGYVPSGTTYQLKSLSQGITEIYPFSNIKGLNDTAYALQINFAPGCTLDYAKTLEMPHVDCKEVFITPNNDGDMDTYLLSGTGSAVIYDKNGKEVKRVTLPYEWNGYASNGLVPQGYYIVVINGGKDKVYISVLY